MNFKKFSPYIDHIKNNINFFIDNTWKIPENGYIGEFPLFSLI